MKRIILTFVIVLLSLPVWAQDDAPSFIGMTLAELIERFGTPETVIAARGNELWQDDVVFRYPETDFYIYMDRVWQVRLASSHGFSNGDRKAVVLLALGEAAEDKEEYILLPVSGMDWPLMLRVNINDSGIVTAIYIYRPDF